MASEPCDLLTEADARALLVAEVERIDFVDLFERWNGPIAEDDLPAVEAAGAKICSYTEVDGEGVVALQLDRRLFSSVDEFRNAWEDDVVILTEPGLAATFDAEGGAHSGAEHGEHSGAISVLLNEQGDSIAFPAYRAGAGRDDLVQVAAEATRQYSN